MRKIAYSGLLFISFFVFSIFCPADDHTNYPLSNASILKYSLAHIEKSYYDLSRADAKDLFDSSLNAIQESVPEILAKCDFANSYCTITVNQAIKRFQIPGNLEDLYARMKEVFQFLDLHVSPDTDKREIEFVAIAGLLDKLDPHSNFLPPEAFKEFQVSTEGNFGGLGIVIGLRDGKLNVIAPLSGTPAAKAGIKTADTILQIDDESTINMDLTEAVNLLRGPVGSSVSIKVERKGLEAPFVVNLKRANIHIDAIQSALLTTPGQKSIGLIRVKSFQSDTTKDFIQNFHKLESQSKNTLAGLIVDLRNNPGGLLDEAIHLSDFLLTQGTIVETVGPNKTLLEQADAKDQGTEPRTLPIVVLINQGSASASEILAGALKYNDRALIVGQQSFGKGSVQTVFQLPEDSGLKLTIAQYLTGGDHSIQSVGITPDIYLNPVTVEKKRMDYIENIYRSEKDLEKHFEISATTKEKPAFSLSFLEQAKPEAEEEATYSEAIDVTKDYVAKLGVELFDKDPKVSRPEWLATLKPVLESEQKAENQKITAKFETIGVAWGLLAKSGATPQAQVQFQLFNKDQPILKTAAGEEVTLHLTLKNVGTSSFSQLIGTSDSPIGIFKDLEFPFGSVAPQQTATWDVPVKVPAGAFQTEAPTTIKFQEKNGAIPPPIDLFVPITEQPQPHFSYEYRLEGFKGKTIPRNKTVHLLVAVTNNGVGPTKEALVNLKNLGGKEIFINKGRLSLKSIPVKATATADLSFHIDPAFTGTTADLELTILDTELLTGVNRKLKLNLETADSFLTPPEKKKYTPPFVKITKTLNRTEKPQLTVDGTAEDDERIKDVYIFVGTKKVFYVANPEQKKTLAFHAEIPLEKGHNVIAVTARDNWDLQNTQQWGVYRP